MSDEIEPTADDEEGEAPPARDESQQLSGESHADWTARAAGLAAARQAAAAASQQAEAEQA